MPVRFVTVLLALALAACSGADRSADDDGVEIVDTSPLSLEATPLVGHWRSKQDVYATELALADDGTFTGQLRRAVVGGPDCDARAHDPCVVAAHGRWRLGPGGKLQLRVVAGGYVTQSTTLTMAYEFSRVPRVLTLRGDEGDQALAEHFGCDGVECAAGTQCAEGDDGAAACVAVPPRAQR